MAKKQNYSYKTRRIDTLTNRMMIVFLLLLISVPGLLYAKNWLDTAEALNHYTTYYKVVKWIPLLPLVLTVISGLFFIKCRKEHRDESLKTVSSSFVLCICAVFLAVALLISKFVYTGYIPSVVFIVVLALLYFISISFPGSYLVVTVFNVFAVFVLYALHLISPIGSPIANYIARAVVSLIIFFIMYLLIEAKKNGGKFRGIKLLKPDTDYLPLFIAAAVFAAAVILGMFNVASYILYSAIIALETIIFALFYAIKMLK